MALALGPVIGKIGGGGLTWEKVFTFPSKTVAWNATTTDRVIYRAAFPTDAQYVYSIKVTVTSGGAAGTYIAMDQTNSNANSSMSIGRMVLNGVGTYEKSLAMPVLSSADTAMTNIGFLYAPVYNSGNHTFSAEVYRAKFDMLP